MSELCFWAGTMRTAPLEQRLEATVAGGFTSMSVFPMDCPDERRCRTVRALCEERGVRLAALDPFTRWLPGWEAPQGIAPEFLALVGCGEDEFFGKAEALGATSMTVLEPFGKSYEAAELVESFAALCDPAAQSGVRVHLEFTPFSGISDLTLAWEVVRGADRPNGGLVFDTWHYLRGRPDDALLATIPGERIFVVQVSDAAREPVGSLIEDTMFHRRLPGEGDWDLELLLARMLAKPGLGEIGIEVLSRSLALLPPEQVGRRCGEALRGLLEAALGRTGG
jgi:4-hydroxyphenylpyruvate dioxygenase